MKERLMNPIDSRIMIIDDNASDLELIKRAFENNTRGNKILCIENGKDALAYLMGEGPFADRVANPFPTMLITDVKMPGVDGFDILEYLQNNPTKAIVPSLVLSSSEDPDDIRTAYRLGAFSYFVKPDKYEDLCDLTKSVLTYWKRNKTPLKDQTGKQIVTNSSGKLGARFSIPS